MEVALLIREKADSTGEQRELAESYITELNLAIAGLDSDRFVVKAQLQYVIEYSNKERWSNLSKGDMLEINSHLSALVLSDKNAGSRYFCESLFWASQPKQAAKT